MRRPETTTTPLSSTPTEWHDFFQWLSVTHSSTYSHDLPPSFPKPRSTVCRSGARPNQTASPGHDSSSYLSSIWEMATNWRSATNQCGSPNKSKNALDIPTSMALIEGLERTRSSWRIWDFHGLSLVTLQPFHWLYWLCASSSSSSPCGSCRSPWRSVRWKSAARWDTPSKRWWSF